MTKNSSYKCTRCRDEGSYFYGGFNYECDCNPKSDLDLSDLNIRGIWITAIIISLVTLII